MMDEEIRQAVSEVREMKQMCGNINMKLTNIVTQRGQDWKKKLEAEYQRGLSEGNDIGYKDGVKDGQNEAWECAKKLFSSMADSDIEKAFPIEWNNGGFNALMNLQPQEAIEKLKAYEEKQKTDDEIKVGDDGMSKIREAIKILNNVIAYLEDYEEISRLNNCNCCGNKNCPYRPKWGERVRINCPLYIRGVTE